MEWREWHGDICYFAHNKPNLRIIVILFSGLYINSCVAKDINDLTLSADEMMIKNFGFSYCLNQTENQALKMEASLAIGGYFQHVNFLVSF
jgi:hypothetical protein